MTFEELEGEINDLLSAGQLPSRLPWDRLDSIKDIVAHAEYGVAMENLCENLFDTDGAFDAYWIDRLESIVRHLHLKDHYLGIVASLRTRK